MDGMETMINALQSAVDAFNAAKAANDEKAMREALQQARAQAANIKKAAPLYFYRRFEGIEGAREKLLAVISAYTYQYKALQEERSKTTDEIVGITIVDKESRVNLLDFCDKLSISKLWSYDCERFNELLTLRAALDLGLKPDPILASYYLSSAAEEKRVGKTNANALSNNSLTKELQAVVDAIIFDDDGNGNNKYKVNSHDVGYVLNAATKAGKERLTIVAAKHNWMRTLLLDVLYRVITPDAKYGIVFKGKK